MSQKIYLASLNILIKNRHQNIGGVNKLITQYGYLVIARLGVPIERQCLKNCSGLITLVVQGTKKEIDEFSRQLNKYKMVTLKKIIFS